MIQEASRIRELPPYLFAWIDELAKEVKGKGVDVINLSIGDPDLPTPPHIVNALIEACQNPANHRYPSYGGMPEFREAIAIWYQRRFGVVLDPAKEVISLIGSKEGIAHLPLAFVNPGDIVLVPTPSYPVYQTATLFVGGKPYLMPLLKEKGFLPDLDRIPREIALKAKLMYLNYPNNPTSAVASKELFQKVVEFAKRYDIIVAHDAAYSEICFDGYRAQSFLEIEGAKEIGIEFHSLSKTYNMTGWRIGFATGNAEIIGSLGKVKTNIDSGVFQTIQEAAIQALRGDQCSVKELCEIYQERRDIMVEGLRKADLALEIPKATFYLWVKIPQGYTSSQFVTHLLE